jgi:hypothetical protein
MNKHTHSHNLMFLLAASPMGMGCVIVADDGDDTTGADTANVTSGQTTEAATDTGTPVTDEGTTSGGADSTSRGESTDADSTATGGGNAQECADYGAKAIECMLMYSEYAEDNCNYRLGYFEGYEDCATTYLAFVGCLSALSCEDLESETACQTELDAFLALSCPTGE